MKGTIAEHKLKYCMFSGRKMCKGGKIVSGCRR